VLDIFIPTFLKTLAIVSGIGGGLLVTVIATAVVLVVTYPITKKFQ